MGSVKRSFLLVKQSFSVLRQDKELLLFPVFSGFVMLLLSASFFLPYYYFVGFTNSAKNDTSILGYVMVFLFYVLSYFVITFFNTGLVTCAAIRLNGEDPSFSDGLRNALKHSGKIFVWSLFAATVGMALRIISEQLGVFGRIFGFFGSLAWSLVTYLIVPILIFGNVSVTDSVRQSATLFKKTWGEQVVGEFSISTFFGLLIILSFLPIGFVLFLIIQESSKPNSHFPLVELITTGVVVVVYFVLLGIISLALQGIYTTALYLYATTSKIPSAFSEDVIRGAFKPKKGTAAVS